MPTSEEVRKRIDALAYRLDVAIAEGDTSASLHCVEIQRALQELRTEILAEVARLDAGGRVTEERRSLLSYLGGLFVPREGKEQSELRLRMELDRLVAWIDDLLVHVDEADRKITLALRSGSGASPAALPALPLTDARPDWEGQAKELMRRGQKISAVKLVRESTGLGLVEAKGLVESWE